VARGRAPRLDFVESERMNVYILQGDVYPSSSLLLAEIPLLPSTGPGEGRCAEWTARSTRKYWFVDISDFEKTVE